MLKAIFLKFLILPYLDKNKIYQMLIYKYIASLFNYKSYIIKKKAIKLVKRRDTKPPTYLPLNVVYCR